MNIIELSTRAMKTRSGTIYRWAEINLTEAINVQESKQNSNSLTEESRADSKQTATET